MALHRARSSGIGRLIAVTMVVGLLLSVGLFAIPPARAAFALNGLTLAPGKYFGGNTYVPGETLSITIRTTTQDTMDLLIQNGSGSPSYTQTGIAMPATLVKTIAFQIPANWPDSNTYTVQVTDTTTGQVRTVAFTIETYGFAVWTDRQGYLAGDPVTVSWTALYAQNYTAAPAGAGAIQVWDNVGNSLITPRNYTFTASAGKFTFTISSTEPTPAAVTVYGWFNDTAGLRHATAGYAFDIGNLGVTVNVQVPGRGYFEPGETVPVTVHSTITGIGGGYEPGVSVSVNVTDQSTGTVVPAYSMTGMTTDGNGVLNYAFQLATTPASGTYQVTATDTAYGSVATSSAPPFDVRPPPSYTVTVTLDKAQYLSGDTLKATANVVSLTQGQTFTYTWIVQDNAGNILAINPGGTTATTYSYATAPTYQGPIYVLLGVSNGTGGLVTAAAMAQVALGYLSISLDKTQFTAGDTITATANLASNAMTAPTYSWTVLDSSGSAVYATSGTGKTASFTTPNPSSSSYQFIVTASQNGQSLRATIYASRFDGFFLQVTLDRSSYNPGDTIVLTYTITPRGVSVLPLAFHFYIDVDGVSYRYQDTTSASGQLTYSIPAQSPTGNLLLYVYEYNTRTYNYQQIHVGAVNPLVADVGGVPLFDILITLLFVALLLAVILLWRRSGMGKAPAAMEMGKPAAPPPPPPSGPSQQAAGPMSVACKHCGASIEITTSKRPIEVMCPSCGETQVVQ